MKITKTVERLIELLLDIDDNDDSFVRFVVGAAGIDENRETLIAYIETRKMKKEEVEKDRLLRIAIRMAEVLKESGEALTMETDRRGRA